MVTLEKFLKENDLRDERNYLYVIARCHAMITFGVSLYIAGRSGNEQSISKANRKSTLYSLVVEKLLEKMRNSGIKVKDNDYVETVEKLLSIYRDYFEDFDLRGLEMADSELFKKDSPVCRMLDVAFAKGLAK